MASTPDADAKTKALEALLNDPFDVRLSKRKDRFVLYDQRLGLSASAAQLDEAYADLAAQREKRLRQFAEEDLLHWIPAAQDSGEGSRGVLVTLKPFLVKSAVIALLFVGGLSMIGKAVDAAGKGIEKSINSVGKWSPEKVETERQRVHEFAERFGPLARELALMFKTDAPPPSPEGQKSPEPQKPADK